MGLRPVSRNHQVVAEAVRVPHPEEFVDRAVERFSPHAGTTGVGISAHRDTVRNHGRSQDAELTRQGVGYALRDQDVRAEGKVRSMLLQRADGNDETLIDVEVRLHLCPRQVIEGE